MIYLDWNDIRTGIWSQLEMEWLYVAINDIIDISVTTGLPLEYVINQAPDKIHKKFIKVLLTIDDTEYTQKKYKNKNIKIDVKDFTLLAKYVNVEVL